MTTDDSRGDAHRVGDAALLRAMLRRAAYVTTDLEAAYGQDGSRARVMIRRIEAGMIMRTDYPVSDRRVACDNHDDLSRWEDEGGRCSPGFPSQGGDRIPRGVKT